MRDSSDDYQYWLNFKNDVKMKIDELEAELMLASPSSHTDDEHQFLIKKVRMFRETLSRITSKLDEFK